ncbi:MAG: hypothetical protein WCT28_03255 [Patescibacteria group bacterium]|jgi:hypothetical protein
MGKSKVWRFLESASFVLGILYGVFWALIALMSVPMPGEHQSGAELLFVLIAGSPSGILLLSSLLFCRWSEAAEGEERARKVS